MLRPPGLGRHGPRQLSLMRCTLQTTLRPTEAGLKRPIPSGVLASFALQGLAPRKGLALVIL